LELDHTIYKNNDTIILKSDTGTGKTTDISKNIKQLMNDNEDLFVISLVARKSLAY